MGVGRVSEDWSWSRIVMERVHESLEGDMCHHVSLGMMCHALPRHLMARSNSSRMLAELFLSFLQGKAKPAPKIGVEPEHARACQSSPERRLIPKLTWLSNKLHSTLPPLPVLSLLSRAARIPLCA